MESTPTRGLPPSGARYARYRPGYPDSLFDFLAGLCRRREAAWDCGTGSGQAARGLAARFDRVVATDASPGQLAPAFPHPRILYATARAEAAPLGDASFDLVAVAQAVHWFQLEAFYREARRVLRPEGVVALWCYAFPRAGDPVDGAFVRFHSGTLGPYWTEARDSVNRGYRDLPFPFQEVRAAALYMQEEWDIDRFLGYLGTWSAVRAFMEREGFDPVERVAPEIRAAWGPGRRTLTWALHLRVGRTPPEGPGGP